MATWSVILRYIETPASRLLANERRLGRRCFGELEQSAFHALLIGLSCSGADKRLSAGRAGIPDQGNLLTSCNRTARARGRFNDHRVGRAGRIKSLVSWPVTSGSTQANATAIFHQAA